MYLKFYGLAEKPFNPTPDPRFLYLSPGHREALAQLHYGVQERQGFIVLTGKVGTGKTTLLHALRQRLDGQTAISYVFNSALSFNGILEYTLEDLGIAKREESRVRRLMALNNFLIERERAGQNTVLIIDEAQNLAPETLEHVRLLSNFETTTVKLLQILLVGQPELKAKLALPELYQLAQRIGLRCQIPPLTPAETGQYVRNRLRVAGASDQGIFKDSALERITQYSGGIPRVINSSAITASCSVTPTRSAISTGPPSIRRSSIWRRGCRRSAASCPSAVRPRRRDRGGSSDPPCWLSPSRRWACSSSLVRDVVALVQSLSRVVLP